MVTTIILDVVGPIIVLIGAGALLRHKFKLDVQTMSKLNIYFLVPCFIFDNVANSKLPWADMGGIVIVTVLQVISLGVIVLAIGKLFGLTKSTIAAIALATMFYNSGNYGLPLAELAYPHEMAVGSGKDGGAVQAFVVMTQNFLVFTVGLSIATFARHGAIWSAGAKILRLPMIPALLAAIACKLWLAGDPSRHLPTIIAKPTSYVSDALVPLALATLGAQLASSPRWPRWRPVGAVLLLRLGFGPILMAALLYGLHLFGIPAIDLWGQRGWPAELLILTASVPTAVNTLLLTLELEGDAALAADCVFWTTIVSCVTIPLWLYAIWQFFGTTPLG